MPADSIATNTSLSAIAASAPFAGSAAAFSSKSMFAIAWRHDQSSSHSAITAPTSPIIDSR